MTNTGRKKEGRVEKKNVSFASSSVLIEEKKEKGERKGWHSILIHL